MLLSAVSVLVVAQSISEIPEGLMNNPVHSAVFNPGITPTQENVSCSSGTSYNLQTMSNLQKTQLSTLFISFPTFNLCVS